MQKTPQVQSRIGFYVSVLFYVLFALVLRIAILVPIAVWVMQPNHPEIALLTPVFYLLVILPLRVSFADAIVQREGERHFSWKRAWSFHNYFGKLGHGLCHCIRVTLWGIPMAALLYAMYAWYNEEGNYALVLALRDIGEQTMAFFYGLRDFCLSVVGITPTVLPAGGITEGFLAVLAVIGVAGFIWMIGFIRNSANRYVWVSAVRKEMTFAKHARTQLRGRRTAQLLVGLANALLVLPVWIVIFSQVKPVLLTISQSLLSILLTNRFPEINWLSMMMPIALVLGCFYLPLIPIRRLLVANFAGHEPKENTVKEKA